MYRSIVDTATKISSKSSKADNMISETRRCEKNLTRIIQDGGAASTKWGYSWLNPPLVSLGWAGLNAQSTFSRTVKNLLSWQWGFPICMLCVFSFLLLLLFILLSPLFTVFMHPLDASLPLYYVSFPPFSPSRSLPLNVLESCCPLMNAFRLFPSLPPSVSVSLSAGEERYSS